MNNDILKLLDELSFLTRETNGASFTIAHIKDCLVDYKQKLKA